ncbi:hypothetical protein COS44_01000 [bacterium (Candidatus Gribaldobacteria) CG03_land_8_20_14_0_80_36_40]|uniref:Type II secretion system protein GspI C-terminal domain-containing protein n=1 Tax=bacterium (Candidatus Gribaldobacteria) CG03_land_8_20_14_0_80_36_40 TaxID=2014271 RepID=A0A2M7BZF0_9BACT|nr:MAG: hypothetical protein COS44_01000 [bacterium (Candidatus Gribaldobacteria) CG03_land_8_20_14_0_80_36_40]
MKFSNAGFTLLEAMIAISILVIGIVAVLQIFPLALNIEKLNQMETQAVFLAQEKIEEKASRSYQDIQVTTETENSLPSPFERFSRETKVIYVDSDLATTTSDLGLKKIEVTVQWQSPLRLGEKSVNLITLIAEK